MKDGLMRHLNVRALAICSVVLYAVPPAFADGESGAPGTRACAEEYDRIDSEIKAANYCERDADCAVLEAGGTLIKFGCYHFVNRAADRKQLTAAMIGYTARCERMIDDCAKAPVPVCRKKRCAEPDGGN